METTLQEMFSGPREVAWRRINGVHTYTDQPVESISAVYDELGLNFDIGLEPMYVKLDGEMVPVPERNAIVRKGVQPRVYGVTGNKYKPLQNREIAKLLNPLLEHWTLDAVASRAGGSELLTVFKTKPLEVNGEPLQEYVWFKETRNGSTALEVAISQVRLFCTNQFISGMRGASFNASVKHGAGVNEDVKFQVSVIQLLDQARTKLLKSYEMMGTRQLTDEEIQNCIERIYPDAHVPGRMRTLAALVGAAEDAGGDLDQTIRDTLTAEQIETISDSQYAYQLQQSKVPVLRQDLATLIEKFNDEHSKLANTSWAVYNAATELADWGGAERGDSAARSALFGPRADVKIRAFSVTMAMTNPQWDKVVAVPTIIQPRQRRRIPAAPPPNLTVEQEAERYRRMKLAQYQRRVESRARRVAEGTHPPRRDEHGNVLPPLTAQEWWDADVKAAKEKRRKLEEALRRAQEVEIERTMSIEERIAQRRQRAQEAAERRRAEVLGGARQPVAVGSAPGDDYDE